MILVTCPCCHGTGWIVTHFEHDDERGTTVHRDPCTHCQGKGEVPSELEED